MLNKKIINKIKNKFPHIDLSGQDFDEWFFKSYLPMVVIKSIGGIKNNPDGSGSFNQETFNSIKSYIQENRKFQMELFK
tara:strand:- start:2290 stop:2526 length:237 start_codon:yes stop_codon:yes gene_type:complete